MCTIGVSMIPGASEVLGTRRVQPGLAGVGAAVLSANGAPRARAHFDTTAVDGTVVAGDNHSPGVDLAGGIATSL